MESRRRAPNVTLPRGRRWSLVAIIVSVAVHVALVFVKFQPWLPPAAPRRMPEQVVLIPLGEEGERAVEMSHREPSAGSRVERVRRSGIAPVPRSETGPAPERVQPPDTGSVVAAVPARDSTPTDTIRGRDRYGRLGPAPGEGKLWVRPLPFPAKELAQAVAKSHYELVDSAVTAIVQAYIDSVLTAPAPPGSAPPSWTGKIGGQTFGIDQKFIYLGPLKIPTMLLALLPIGNAGAVNLDLTKMHQLDAMREDLQFAARRAQTMEDFKRAVRELRTERERQREFNRNQRLPPGKTDTSKVVTP